MLPSLPPPAHIAQPAPPRPAINTLCPVLGEPVDADSPTVTVRGRTYRVCCAPCKADLQAKPDAYLRPDGTPKNHALEAAAKPAPPPPAPPTVPREQAPAYLPPPVAALLGPQARDKGGQGPIQAWSAPGFDPAQGLASASLFYLPQPLVPEVLTAWHDLTSPRLRPGSAYRMEAAVTWMDPARKVKASGMSLFRMGTLCVEGLVKDGLGNPVAAFRAETLFSPEQKRMTPGPKAVEAILKRIATELALP